MAKQIPFNQLREERSNKNDKLPFVITHNPRNYKIITVAKANLSILGQDEKMRRLVNSKTLLQSKRLLTRARFDQKGTFSVSNCRDSRCGACPYIHVGKEMNKPNGLLLFTNENITCKSENLIYCIQCSGCQEIYIGQTGNCITERVIIHRQHIRRPEYKKNPP